MCDYHPSNHFSKQATDRSVDRCVSKTMAKMSDTKSCVNYMSTVLPDQSRCSVQNVEAICTASKADFSVADARKLCGMKTDAARSFWGSLWSSRGGGKMH